MVVNLSKIIQQKAEVLQSLRDLTKSFLAKYGYSQKTMATAVGISETYLNDFLNGRRGMSPIWFTKIEHVLSLKTDQRKLQFYSRGSTGGRIANLQENGKKVGKSMQLNHDSITAIRLRHERQLLKAMEATGTNRNVGLFEDKRNAKTLSK